MKKIKYYNKNPKFKNELRVKQVKTESVPLGELAKENGLDMIEMAKRINISFLLADIIEGLILEVEEEIKKVDNTLTLNLRHPVSRIKIHSREMVRFVSETYRNGDGAIDFGDKSDELKDLIFNYFEKKNESN